MNELKASFNYSHFIPCNLTHCILLSSTLAPSYCWLDMEPIKLNELSNPPRLKVELNFSIMCRDVSRRSFSCIHLWLKLKTMSIDLIQRGKQLIKCVLQRDVYISKSDQNVCPYCSGSFPEARKTQNLQVSQHFVNRCEPSSTSHQRRFL